jgi:ribosomal protein L37AE/L43A
LFAAHHASLMALADPIRRIASFAALGLLVLTMLSYAMKRHNEETRGRYSWMHRLRERYERTAGNVDVNAQVAAPDTVLNESASPSAAEPRPASNRLWSVELLHELEWKRFEALCTAYYEKRGFRVESMRYGADGGIEAKLFFRGMANAVAVLQCKAWNHRPVGIKAVRELLGVMAHTHITKGISHAMSTYSDDAIALARGNKITLISGEDFLRKIAELPEDVQKDMLRNATEGDYTTPTCPSCAIKMVRRSSQHGFFWSCANYPRCRQKFTVRAEQRAMPATAVRRADDSRSIMRILSDGNA